MYIFHHMPKCGGTSVANVLAQWFSPVIRDYRPEEPELYPEFLARKQDIDAVPANGIIVSHFEIDGCHLHQRYPEALAREDIKVFTFIRDPLELRMSLFYHEHRDATAFTSRDVEDALLDRGDYIAHRIPCDAATYREAMARYFFVGVQDALQESFDALARLLGKPRIALPRLNTRHCGKNTLSPAFVEEFKRKNALDYRIYDLAKDRLRQVQASQGMPDAA